MKIPENQGLAHMQRMATGLLIFSATAFLICAFFEHHHPLFRIFRGAFEGAMIGGIADWFAVTALFRHPLGIPIAHTALIPKRKDEIGRQLGKFIRINFLQPKLILEKWRSLGFLNYLQSWLTTSGSIQKVAAPILSYSAEWIHQKASAVSPNLTVAKFEDFWRQQQLSSQLHKMSQHILTAERRKAAIDQCLELLDEFLDRKGSAIGKGIAIELEKSGRDIIAIKFSQAWPDLQRKLQAKLYRARYEPDFPLRSDIDAFFEKLVTDTKMLTTIESSVFSLLRDPEVEQLINSTVQSKFENGISSIANQLRENPEEISGQFEQMLIPLWNRVFTDPALRIKIERGTEALLLRMIRRYAHTIESFIAAQVANWDGKQTADLIEAQVGKDLQWIRINGSLIGFLCGGVIQIVALIAIASRI